MLYNNERKEWEHSGGSSGISRVHVYYYPINNTCRIIGRKVQDDTVSINCALAKGLKYSEATPTFHEWRDPRNPRQYGLDFPSEEDAKAFGQAVNVALTFVGVDIPHDLEVGSMVEVLTAKGFPIYGVIRWIGNIPHRKDKLFAGLEMEDEESTYSDGTFLNEGRFPRRYFTCPAGRGFFTLLTNCRQDSRFAPNTPTGDTSFQSEKVNQPSETKLNLQRQLREMEEQLTNCQGQLRDKELQEVNLHEQLREKDQQLDNSALNFHGHLRQKDQQLENAQRQLMEMEQQLRGKDQQQENAQRQLREMEQQLREKDQQQENAQRQLREMEQQMREKDQQQENAQRQLREMEQQLTNLQGQFRQKEEETTTLEGQLRAKDQEVNELEITLSTAQQALNDQQRQQSPDWVIPGDQIQLTDRCLGRGGWGSVVEGKYCGCAVAVKQIHELILSPHNRSLFEREMDIASRCRHPCLLQFIGATNDEGSPLFVTELMETSLRALLEQQPLSATEVSIISLDVARALNYLHHKEPSPIIHRDISSANVLLWRQGDQWRGKVSDYGTANFMQQTMTIGPGAMIYSAPEAVNPRSQTVKIDVYSFGVLLCEMCIRELPDPERRDQQVAMVTNRLLRALIRGCLHSEPETRPNMEEIVEELQEPA